jgi:hypothetical protein
MNSVKKFIKLHTRADNAPVIINTDVVNDITYDVKNKYSVITFINENSCIDVKENVEKIYEMMYETSKTK